MYLLCVVFLYYYYCFVYCRLGIAATDDVSIKLTENGGDDNNNNNSSSGSETESTRVLRKKKNNLLVNNSSDINSPFSPKKCRRLSEGYAVDGVVTLHSSNGRLSKEDNTTPFKQRC